MKILSKIENFKNHQTYLKTKQLAKTFLQEIGYSEIEVPLLSPVLIPEAYLEVFETQNKFFDEPQKMYLTPSPELFAKILLANGLENCYCLNKSFRNCEPHDIKHSHEFSMLEIYKTNIHYFELADDVLKMFRYVAKNLFGKEEIIYKGQNIFLTDYEKITVTDAFLKYANIDNIFDHDFFYKQAKAKGYRIDNMSYADLWSQIYGLTVEPNLGKNGKITMIYEYPRELAATACYDEIKKVCDRFEFYIGGVELGNGGNASTGKTNIKEYEKTFEGEIKERILTDKIIYPPAYEFIEAVKQMQKCAGVGIGFDRMAMIFADCKSIYDLRLIDVVY